MFRSDSTRPLVRIVAALAGLAVMARGLAGFWWRGTCSIRTGLGGFVYARFATVLGLAVILSALLRPEILGRTGVAPPALEVAGVLWGCR